MERNTTVHDILVGHLINSAQIYPKKPDYLLDYRCLRLVSVCRMLSWTLWPRMLEDLHLHSIWKMWSSNRQMHQRFVHQHSTQNTNTIWQLTNRVCFSVSPSTGSLVEGKNEQMSERIKKGMKEGRKQGRESGGKEWLTTLWMCERSCTHLVTVCLAKSLSLVCPQGLYGINCSEQCACPKSAICDPRTGECICQPGRHGPQCNQGNRLVKYWRQWEILAQLYFHVLTVLQTCQNWAWLQKHFLQGKGGYKSSLLGRLPWTGVLGWKRPCSTVACAEKVIITVYVQTHATVDVWKFLDHVFSSNRSYYNAFHILIALYRNSSVWTYT